MAPLVLNGTGCCLKKKKKELISIEVLVAIMESEWTSGQKA